MSPDRRAIRLWRANSGLPQARVFRAERARGPVWYAKYRLPEGRHVQKRLAPAWTERERPPAGYFTKRLAKSWLRELWDEAGRGTLPGLMRTGATSEDAAARGLEHSPRDP